jgi:hypothetical protein
VSANAWTAVFTSIYAAFTLILAVTGVWALVYAKKQLRQGREADKIKHLLRFVEQFDNVPLAATRKALADKRLKGIEDPPEAENVLNFFETIGLLVKRDYLDAHDVWSSFSYWMFCMFADCRELIEQEQKEDPTYYSDFTSLVERLKAIEKVEHGLSDRPSKEDVMEFWQYELGLTAGLPAAKRKRRKSAGKKSN